MDSVGHVFLHRILQHRLCLAGNHLFPDSVADGDFRRRKRVLQQLLRTRTTLSADRQHVRLVAKESSPQMVVVQVVPKRIPGVLYVLLCPNDLAHGTSSTWLGRFASDYPPPVDLRRTVALGLPHTHRTLDGAVRLWPLRHYADVAHRGCGSHRGVSTPHLVCVLPDGQHDPDDFESESERDSPRPSPRINPRLLAERLSIVLFAARTLKRREIN